MRAHERTHPAHSTLPTCLRRAIAQSYNIFFPEATSLPTCRALEYHAGLPWVNSSTAADPAPGPPRLVLVGQALVREDDEEEAITPCVDE